MKPLLTLILLFFCFCSFGQEVEWVVEPTLEYDNVYCFKNGVAFVEKNYKRGLVNNKGIMIVKIEEFDQIYPFSEGLACVEKNKKFGFIDKSGKVVIPLQYDAFNPFSEGLAGVKINEKFGFIDKSGKVVIPFKYQDVNSFSEGLASVQEMGKWGMVFINKTGKVVINSQFHTGNVPHFSEGFAVVRKIGMGVIDKSGKIVVPFDYDNIEDFKEGLSKVRKSSWEGYGFIDKSGEIVIPMEYSFATNFSEGMANVSKLSSGHGFIDKNGKIAVPLEYDNFSDFHEGLALVRKGDKLGYVDKNGKIVIPVIYVGYDYHFSEGLAVVRKDFTGHDFGFVSKTGKIIIPFEFDDARSFSEGLAWVKKDGKWGIIKHPLKNEPITPNPTIAKPIVSWVSPNQEETISTESNQTLKACISSDTRPSQIQLLLNGKPYSLKDFVIEPANSTNCDYSYELSLNITTKNEPLNFVLSVTNEGGTSQSARKITIKETKPNTDNLPKIYAVIIGIADYQGEADDLKYCADDAQKVYDFLKSPNGGRVPENQIRYFTNSNATSEQVLQATNALFSKAKPNDQIMFYFSGHGGVGYFCGYDDNIQHEAVRNIFMNSQAQRKICIADACHSGSWEKARKELAMKSRALSPEEMTQLYYNSLTNSGTGLALFMSCQENEKSIDHPDLKQGLFTYYFLEGLKGGADINFDKIITIQELYDYTRTRVSKSAQNDFMRSQIPKLKGTFDLDTPVGVVR